MRNKIILEYNIKTFNQRSLSVVKSIDVRLVQLDPGKKKGTFSYMLLHHRARVTFKTLRAFKERARVLKQVKNALNVIKIAFQR